MAKHFQLQAILLTALLFSAVFGILPAHALLGESKPLLTPYSATYHLTRDGMAAEVTRKLERSGEGRWQLHDSARVLFFSMQETAIVDFDGENIKPVKYRHRQSPGNSKDQTIRYDWKKQQATFDLDDGERTAKLKKETFDRLSYQIQLRLDLLAGRLQQPRTYDLVDRGRHKQYRIEKVGEEMLTLDNRQIQTLKLRQTRIGKDRETFIWVAPDLDYLIIKMERDDDDGRIRMQLKPESLKFKS
ncbi:hypothetical protein FHR99_001993 [Litorivivens lipolytica]|uniref:DUF3108 domain-containing protein n=1 Tax=Litorivivens lipolytica TaxID=1524264 RepID=A0A7W4W6G9_9GAMM|nr:DUF3108 domain-containing protein [Litorivivens lipolytica]MBB3047727.1 hypothetical protein [Litorivivens lipolytica]